MAATVVANRQIPPTGSNNIYKTTADFSDASTNQTAMTLTGCSFTGAASTVYRIRGTMRYTSSATPAAPTFTFTGPSGATMDMQVVSNSTTGNGVAGATLGTYVGTTSTTSLGGIVTFTAVITLSSTAGTVQLMCRKGATGAGTLTIRTGSDIEVTVL